MILTLYPLFRKANWDKFQLYVHNQLTNESLPDFRDITENDVDQLIEKLTNTMIEGQKISVPFVHRTPYAVSLTAEIKAKIRLKNNLRRTTQRYP